MGKPVLAAGSVVKHHRHQLPLRRGVGAALVPALRRRSRLRLPCRGRRPRRPAVLRHLRAPGPVHIPEGQQLPDLRPLDPAADGLLQCQRLGVRIIAHVGAPMAAVLESKPVQVLQTLGLGPAAPQALPPAGGDGLRHQRRQQGSVIPLRTRDAPLFRLGGQVLLRALPGLHPALDPLHGLDVGGRIVHALVDQHIQGLILLVRRQLRQLIGHGLAHLPGLPCLPEARHLQPVVDDLLPGQGGGAHAQGLRHDIPQPSGQLHAFLLQRQQGVRHPLGLLRHLRPGLGPLAVGADQHQILPGRARRLVHDPARRGLRLVQLQGGNPPVPADQPVKPRGAVWVHDQRLQQPVQRDAVRQRLHIPDPVEVPAVGDDLAEGDLHDPGGVRIGHALRLHVLRQVELLGHQHSASLTISAVSAL